MIKVSYRDVMRLYNISRYQAKKVLSNGKCVYGEVLVQNKNDSIKLFYIDEKNFWRDVLRVLGGKRA